VKLVVLHNVHHALVPSWNQPGVQFLAEGSKSRLGWDSNSRWQASPDNLLDVLCHVILHLVI